MASRIRGQETKVALVVDGQLLGDSFTKVENLSIKPVADLMASDFLGETESDPDLMHHGYEGSFSCHEMTNVAFDLWDSIVNQVTAGLPLPRINLAFIKRYRDPAIPAKTITMQNVVMKMDSHEMSSRKEFVKSSFSFKCRTKRTR